jgi:hypothetical protein
MDSTDIQIFVPSCVRCLWGMFRVIRLFFCLFNSEFIFAVFVIFAKDWFGIVLYNVYPASFAGVKPAGAWR